MGWIGTVFTVAGVWNLKRLRLACLLLVIGNVCWIVEGVLRHQWDVVVLNAILLIIGLRNVGLHTSTTGNK